MRRSLGLACAVVLASCLLVAGCLPAPATSQARAVTDLWTIFVVAAALVGILVWGLITIAILRYRRHGQGGGRPPQTASALPIEIAWTVGPILLVLFLFASTVVALGQIDAVGPTRVTVAVNAFRWQWQFTYRGTGVSIVGTRDTPAEMVVPVGEPIHIVLTSSDVIHAFYVPEFLFQRDAIPGHPSDFDFTVEQAGTYNGQCAEFCGVYHDQMLLSVRAVSRPEFDAWLANQAAHLAHPSPSAPSPLLSAPSPADSPGSPAP